MDDDELPYTIGHDFGRKFARLGMHPDAIRFVCYSVEEIMGEPFDPPYWRGLEDALAGRSRRRDFLPSA
jgi:hypothetical protein